MEMYDPNQLINKSIGMIGKGTSEGTVMTSYQPDVWKVNIDRDQIEQVLVDILNNAVQAMPEGGRLQLETANETLDESQASRYRKNSGKSVRFSI